MEANVSKAFKIIIQHFSGQTLCQSQEEIYDSVKELDQDEGLEPVTLDDVRRTLRYLNYFGLAEKRSPCCWHIKSVDDMCARLRDLDDNRNIGNNDQPHGASIAFEIIIQHFSDTTFQKSQREIYNRVMAYVYQDELHLVKFHWVSGTLRYLNYFGLAEKRSSCYWRIKSVDDMCARLRDLVDNRNIGDEGEDF